jgi:hypothetical protein
MEEDSKAILGNKIGKLFYGRVDALDSDWIYNDKLRKFAFVNLTSTIAFGFGIILGKRMYGIYWKK